MAWWRGRGGQGASPRGGKTELIKPHGPWKTPEQVESATLDYIDWFNNRRLFETCGDISPAELEQHHYRQNASLAEAS